MNQDILSRQLNLQKESLATLMQPLSPRFAKAVAASSPVRLIRLDEINEERHQAYRQALANVYATLDPEQKVRFLYLLDGNAAGVSLYFGVTSDEAQSDQLHESMKNLRGALEGQLPGINFGEEVKSAEKDALFERLRNARKQGLMLGVPTGQGQDEASEEQNFQGLDRLVRALQSGSRTDNTNDASWQLVVVSQPLPRHQVHGLLDDAYTLSSQVAALVRTSIQASGNSSRQTSASTGISDSEGSNESLSNTRGTSEGASDTKSWGDSSSSNSSSSSRGSNTGGSQTKNVGTNESNSKSLGTSITKTRTENHSLSDTTGSSLGITQDFTNKRAQHWVDHIDKQLIPRLQKGLTKGLFHSAVYLVAENGSTYQRLKNTLRATFQGDEATLSPLHIHDIAKDVCGEFLRLPVLESSQEPESLLFCSLQAHNGYLGNLLTADELAIVASLPQNELQGVRRRKTVSFIVDLPDVDRKHALDLGSIIDRGRLCPNNPVRLARTDLNKHVFVTGVTGAGKTTTCLNLLLESRLPFLVIEPAKTEYRALARHLSEAIDYYRPNGDDFQSLRINPFALLRKGQRIKSHAGFLKNVFTAVFPMEASMPMMVEAAILAAYEDKGWDCNENEYLPEGDPFDPSCRAWPTMSDMICQLDRLIPTYGLGKEFEEKYRGSLVSRLRSLTDGTLGRILDVPQSIDFAALIKRRVVIELEELQGGEEKALLMALLLGAINETMRARHEVEPEFRQLTLIEEAHRLLSRPEQGDKAAALAVESFADMLAEVRKYGAGLIIADQIPAKLIPDVIKNTHTKIVHRLFAEDDRRAMGEAMMMDDAQRNFLPNLGTGESIVFCGGWHGPAHAAIRNDHAQTDNRLSFQLDERCIRQLWRERERYYPQFSRLGWLSTNDGDAQDFATFVRTTRQAHNQWLHLMASDKKRQALAEGAFTRLKNWMAQWKPVAARGQSDYEQRCIHTSEDAPSDLLAAAWVALLLDANPQPHASEKEVPSLLVAGERPVLTQACMLFLELLEKYSSVTELQRAVALPECRDLKVCTEHLARFKSF